MTEFMSAAGGRVRRSYQAVSTISAFPKWSGRALGLSSAVSLKSGLLVHSDEIKLIYGPSWERWKHSLGEGPEHWQSGTRDITLFWQILRIMLGDFLQQCGHVGGGG